MLFFIYTFQLDFLKPDSSPPVGILFGKARLGRRVEGVKLLEIFFFQELLLSSTVIIVTFFQDNVPSD